MSIRYKSLTALDYKTMSIGNDILCANLKERIRKQEALVDKNTNLALSFENAMDKTLFVPLRDDAMIPRNATVIYKIETKASGKKELIVSNRTPGSYQPMDGTKFGPYKPFQQ